MQNEKFKINDFIIFEFLLLNFKFSWSENV